VKCTNWVAEERYGTKGKTRKHNVPKRFFDQWIASKPGFRESLVAPPKRCQGTLKIEIKAVDTPDYVSDHYAELDIKFICSNCGPNVVMMYGTPHAYTLSAWVTTLMNRVKSLPWDNDKAMKDRRS
jgi:hypothetical protein